MDAKKKKEHGIMRKLFLLLAVVLVLTAINTNLNAGILKNLAGAVSIWLPDDWETDSDEQEMALYADAPAGDSFCVLQVLVEKNDLSAALKIYRDALSEEMDNFTVTREAQRSTLNGLEAITISGEGLRDEMTWSVDVRLIATEKAALMCAMGWEKDKEEIFAPLRDKILPSIKMLD